MRINPTLCIHFQVMLPCVSCFSLNLSAVSSNLLMGAMLSNAFAVHFWGFIAWKSTTILQISLLGWLFQKCLWLKGSAIVRLICCSNKNLLDFCQEILTVTTLPRHVMVLKETSTRSFTFWRWEVAWIPTIGTHSYSWTLLGRVTTGTATFLGFL